MLTGLLYLAGFGCFMGALFLLAAAVVLRAEKVLWRSYLWMGNAQALNAVANMRDGDRTGFLISSVLAAGLYYMWWKNGGGDNTRRRLRRLRKKFKPVRRTAPVMT